MDCLSTIATNLDGINWLTDVCHYLATISLDQRCYDVRCGYLYLTDCQQLRVIHALCYILAIYSRCPSKRSKHATGGWEILSALEPLNFYPIVLTAYRLRVRYNSRAI
jgi:hypothetical protein